MPLPKIDLPIHELKIVSLPEPIKFRPFLVKEEKLLLMALESDDESSILSTVKQVINNCLLTEIDIDKIPIFDIEYLFLNIRARSIGENVDTFFVCRNVIGTETNEEGIEESVQCGHPMKVNVNLLDVKPPISDLPSKLYLSHKIGVQLKFPNINTFKSIKGLLEGLDSQKVFDLIYDCTEYIFDEFNMYYVKDTEREEFYSFLESLTQEQFDKIVLFFESLPTIAHDVEHTCEKCEFKHKIHMEGLNDFFT